MIRSGLRDSVSAAFRTLQDNICRELAEAAGQTFHEDIWTYENGEGGGRTRIFEGDVIEKGGVNFSGLEGQLSEKMAARLEVGQDRQFYASGVSLVLHARNPFVPTVHMNVRYLERGDKCWFGGGIDLTPTYPFEEDIVQFHRTLKATCDEYEAGDYARFKQACDDYFFIRHRNEARGVGGIFFDYMADDLQAAFEFTKALGQTLTRAYLPILATRKEIPYGTRQRDFQLYRRGRYVEFNLVYDRGTLFGLETGGRIESILMSLPPLTAWRYDWQPEPGSPEAALAEVLKPRDWAGES